MFYTSTRGMHDLGPWGIAELLKDARVIHVRGDQCQLGLKARVDLRSPMEGPCLRPTGFMSNSWCILEQLGKRRQGGHKHVPRLGGIAAGAARYPPEL